MTALAPSRLLTFGAIALILAVAAMLIVFSSLGERAALPMHDFVEYWAAGRLLLDGDNPYDPERVHELEREAGHTEDSILMWNPPWAMPLVMPLGLLPVRTAHLLWVAFQFGVILFSADRLWQIFGGSSRLAPLVVACTFAPTWFALIAGQISPLLLLGAVLFLVFVRERRDFLAGLAASLLGIKPHLATFFWLALLLWSIRERRWKVIAGGIAAGVALTGVALLFDSGILGHYWTTMTNQPPAQYRSPTLGTLVRMAVGEGAFRWQFLPLLPGLAWFIWYYRRHREEWDWSARLPMLLIVSMLTAAYGAWPFDLVLLLVPVFQIATRTRARVAAQMAHLALNGLALLMILRGVEYLGFIWIAPAVLLGYVGLLHASIHEPAPGPRPA